MNLDERLQKDLSPDIYCLMHNKIVYLEQQVKKQKEFIKFLEDNWKKTQDIWYIKILQKYKEIIDN